MNSGYKGILSDDDLWYLNSLSVRWQQMYENEPLEDISNVDAQKLVLGGEGCMWGEHVDNSNLENTVWPRAAAIAEKLWSGRDFTVNVTVDTTERMRYFRCLMNERGIAAGEPERDGGKPPRSPGSCYNQ